MTPSNMPPEAARKINMVARVTFPFAGLENNFSDNAYLQWLFILILALRD
jgi:hypothetical protein